MAARHVKVAITGAAGQIGYALCFRVASGQMFGPDTDVSLHLIELPQAMSALEGVAMELADCAFPRLRNLRCTSDLHEGMDGVHWALLVGAVPRKQGMERSDLLKINGAVFKAQGEAINAKADDDVQVLVVGNPCNTNAYIAYHHAPDVSPHRFYAMTMLDENRARAQLAEKAGVPVGAVQSMHIWGNHSATQFPDYFHAMIDGRPALDAIDDHAWFTGSFIPSVQQRGAAIIRARGASSAASAANAVVDSVAAVEGVTGHPEQPFSLAVCSQGAYGADTGLVVSYPCLSQGDGTGVSVCEGLSHGPEAQVYWERTLDELRQEATTVKALGLLDPAS